MIIGVGSDGGAPQDHDEDALDEALDESFPASDPIAVTRPHPVPPPEKEG